MIIPGKAVILLHEIYGVNDFMELVASRYRAMGFQVFIYDMFGGKTFDYEQGDEACRYFYQNVGFDIYRKVENMAKNLKNKFNTVLLVGFSVGATIAWRCCENPLFDGILCHYGSRIRDYSDLTPTSPVLTVFAEQESFDVYALAKIIEKKPQVHSFIAKNVRHGFLDPYSSAYSEAIAEETYGWIYRKIEERLLYSDLYKKRR